MSKGKNIVKMNNQTKKVTNKGMLCESSKSEEQRGQTAGVWEGMS